jgi:serine/threonine-protein kinase RsbW
MRRLLEARAKGEGGGMDSGNPPVTLTIPNDPRLMPLVRGFVETVCQVADLDQATTDAIVLATNEAASNAIRHAHRDCPEALVRIECRIGTACIEVCLLDEGEPFDLASVPNLDPAEVRVGGRGIFLMRALMDELDCQPRGKRGNAIRMVKHCQPNPNQSAVDGV